MVHMINIISIFNIRDPYRISHNYNRYVLVIWVLLLFHLKGKIIFKFEIINNFQFFLTATVECYNPRTNEWTYVAKMNEPHYGHAGTVYGGVMYISGKQL